MVPTASGSTLDEIGNRTTRPAIARLVDAHLQDLLRSGLNTETILASGIYSASPDEVAEILGFGAGGGMAIPYPANGDGTPFVRIRLDKVVSDGKRYRSPKGSTNRLYVSRLISPEMLADVSMPIYITEGEKKALKAYQEGLLCVGLAGVWSWRTKTSDGRGVPLPDLDKIPLEGRIVYVVFDSDIVSKPGVKAAESALAAELAKRGAQVLAIRLPAGPNGEKVGLDDYLVTHSVESFSALNPVPLGKPPEVVTMRPPPPAAVAQPLTMPAEAMVGLGRDFADLYGQYLESPRSFLYMAFLTYLGAGIARKVTLASELRPEPRLYTVVVGESADTRKSTALRITDGFFRVLNPDWIAGVLYGVGSAEGIAAELKESPTLILHFDELKSFVDKAKAEHSVALPMVSTLFERGDYDNRVKAERVSVRGASLSLIAACTSDTYATMFDSRFFAIGFLNRLFIVVDRTTNRIALPRVVPEPEVEALRGRVRGLLREIDKAYATNGLRPVALSVEPGAMAMFERWYKSREGSIFERRLDTYAHRLMVLLAASSGKEQVDVEVMEAVLALIRYQLDARREADPVDAENTIARLEEKIRRVLVKGAASGRDLKRKCNYNRVGIWAWQTAISNLLRVGEVLHAKKDDLYYLAPGVIAPVITAESDTFAHADAE